MRLNEYPLVPDPQAGHFSSHMTDLLSAIAQQLNLLSDGRLAGVNGVGTAAPTGGTWAVGDQVRNSAPTEAGAAASKYVIVGWICTASGTPGTWLAMRTLTGN